MPQNKTEQLKAKKAIKAKQAAFLAALPDHSYNVSKVCRALCIGRTTYYSWQQLFPEFKERLDEVLESQVDEWEAALHKNIKAGDATSIIFGLKCRAKHRGYSERETVSSKAVAILEHVLSGDLTAREAGYKLALLGLPLPEVLKIELSKERPVEDDPSAYFDPFQFEQKVAEAMEAVGYQREHFVPERQAEVAQLKDELKGLDSFSPEIKGELS
jgi:hypothetical protein